MPVAGKPRGRFSLNSVLSLEGAMSILSFENLELSYGVFTVFSGISARISNDSKIGLIGPNGIGKTSLLLIIAGQLEATSGKVQMASGKKVGYLPQEAMDAFADRKNTPYEEMLSVFTGLREMQKKLRELEERMSSGSYTEKILDEYGSLQTAFEISGGYTYETRIKQTLDGLGLKEKDWHTPIRNLSGGQKTRAMLARLLLEKPDLLMLDEPTNHLDIEAVEWLERTLREWDGAVLIVSHDRYFLDNTVNTIFEMSRTKIETYSGSYSDYLVQREERWAYFERVFDEEKARLLNEVEFIQKNWVRASTHARALGLLRRLSRDLAIVDAYGIMALRSGKQWSEMGLSSDRPLDVVEAVRKVNSIQISNGRPPQIRPRLQS
ncbi:MAG: ABC transporter ATP-binding protein, partial [Chloroflexi bacterium]